MRHTQFSHTSVPSRLQRSQQDTTLRSVWQDKPLPDPAPRSFPAASPAKKMMRPASNRHENSSFTKPHQKHSTKRQKVKLYIWVDQLLKTEIERIATREGLSLSSVGRAGLEEWVRQQLHIQHTVLLQPIIETTLRKFFSRMIFFLARIAFDIGVIKGLMIWLCRRLAGASKEQVDSVINQSRERARKSLTSLTPEFATFLEDLKKALQEEEGS